MKRTLLTWKQGITVGLAFLLSQGAQAETLRNVLQSTLHTNPDIQITVKDRAAINQDLQGARSDYLPTLDATATAGRQHSDIPAIGSPITTTNTLYNRQASITADENLFNGFGTVNEVKRNRARVCSADNKIVGTAQDILLDTTEAYINVLKEQKLVHLAQNNLRVHQGVGGLISQRSESGIGETADTDQSRGRLALAKANLTAEQGNLADAKARYFQLTGTSANFLSQPHAPSAQFLPIRESQAIKIALANHPTLKSAKADMLAAHAQHQAAAAKYFPRFDLQLIAQRGKDIGGVEGENNQETAQIVMNYNLFHGGADHARRRATAYLYQESAEVMHKTYRQVIENVQFSWDALSTVKSQLSALKTHQTESASTYDAYRQQFQLDKRSLLDVLDAQNEYYDASRAYVNAQYTVLFDQYRLLNSMGELLPSLGIRLPT